jgi:uncharacterized membrane protein YphA (DoxX/SURF4 family)
MEKELVMDRQQEAAWMPMLSLAVRLVLGVIFLVAGAEKLTALDPFAHAIANYKIVPLPLINIAALLFVWTEIAIGIFLIAGMLVRGSALVAGTMLIVFLIAILSAMARGLEIDCGCFANANGVAGEKVGWPKVWEDVALLAAAVFLIYFPRSYFMIDRWIRQEGRPVEQV